MNNLEIVASILGLLSVWLTVKQNIWCWPTGLLMVILYLIIFWEVKLYADMALQGIYIVFQIYGWYEWLYGGRDRTELKVSRLKKNQAYFLTFIAILSIIIIGYCLENYTDASLPYWDATTTVLSLVAQWLLTKKILENWLIWIAVDVLSIGIYIYKSLYLTAGLYTVFLILATSGYLVWKKTLLKEQPG